MARGVPVACSDRASLPEVAGDAALLFDPEDARRDRRRRSSGCSRDGALRERPARGRARAGGAVHAGSATRRADRSRATRARGPGGRSAVDARCAASARATGARRSRANQRSVDSRSAAPPSWTRTIASARSSGAAESATKPLTPSSTSSTAALSGPRDDDARRPRARPPRRRPSRSPRGARAAAGTSARRSARLDSRGVDEPGRLDDALAAPASSIARSAPAPRSGPSPKITPRELRRRARARARPRGGTARRGFSGMWRPAKTTSGSACVGLGRRRAARVLALEHASTSPRRPSSRSRSRVQAREAEGALAARARTRAAPPADAPADRPEVLAPVVAAPHLVPVDDEPEAPRSGRASAGGQQREVRERRGVDDVVAAAVAQQVPQHAERRRRSGGSDRGGCRRARRGSSRGPTATHVARPGSAAARPRSHCTQRQVGDLVPVGGQPLGEVAVPALGAADGVREQAVVDEADPHRQRRRSQTRPARYPRRRRATFAYGARCRVDGPRAVALRCARPHEHDRARPGRPDRVPRSDEAPSCPS